MHWRLIVVFLPERSVSDWPAVEIIASLVVSGTGSQTQPLSCGCPYQSTALSSVSGSSGRGRLLHCTCKYAPQNNAFYLSVVAKVLDITHYRIKGWTVLLPKTFVQHHQCTFQHPQLWSIQTPSWTRSLFKTCHSLLVFNVFLGRLVQMLPVIRNCFKKLRAHQQQLCTPRQTNAIHQLRAVSDFQWQALHAEFGRLFCYMKANVSKVCVTVCWEQEAKEGSDWRCQTEAAKLEFVAK